MHHIFDETGADWENLAQVTVGFEPDDFAIRAEAIPHDGTDDIGAFALCLLDDCREIATKLDKFVEIDDNRPFVRALELRRISVTADAPPIKWSATSAVSMTVMW